MIRLKTVWLGGVARQAEQAAWDGLRRAVVHYWTAVVNALNVSNPRPHKTPSRPGEPPRKRTGTLQVNVLYEFDRPALAARVGVGANAPHGPPLERGTRRMKARPFLLATLRKVLPQLRALAGGGGGP